MADKRGPTVSLKAFSPASGCVLACIRRWDHEVAMAGHGECVTVTGRIREHGTLREGGWGFWVKPFISAISCLNCEYLTSSLFNFDLQF